MSQRLNSFFTGSPELRKLAQGARQLAAMQRLYEKATPPSLARASRVIRFEQHILTLGADNSAVAAKLRHLVPQLLLQLQGNEVEVTGILVRVQVAEPPTKRSPTSPALGQTGRQELADLAASMKDSPLKDAIQRLIKH